VTVRGNFGAATGGADVGVCIVTGAMFPGGRDPTVAALLLPPGSGENCRLIDDGGDSCSTGSGPNETGLKKKVSSCSEARVLVLSDAAVIVGADTGCCCWEWRLPGGGLRNVGCCGVKDCE
jgi:hypothetical protein